MNCKKLTTLVALLSLSCGIAAGALPAAAQKALKGGVSEEELLRNQVQGLDRNAIQHKGDPFNGNGGTAPVDTMLEAPPGSFDVNSMRPPAPPLKGTADDQGADFGGQSMPAMEDAMPPVQQAAPPPRMNPMQGNAVTPNKANEPDSSAEMQLLWDAWHKRVAETIFTKFNALAQLAFKHSPPLACEVSYAVSRDGQIGNLTVIQKSSSPMFNAMLLGVVKSMNGNPVLQFPPGSRRQYVEKTGTFTWNYGQQGFKYTTGDQERIKQSGGQPRQNQNPPMQQMQQFNQMQQQPMQQMQQQFSPMQQMQQPMQQQFNPMQQMQQMQQPMRQQQFNPMQMMQQMMGH